MRKFTDYIELTPRIRGKKSFMLVKSDYDSMLTAENVQAALRRLEGSRYQPYISQFLVREFNVDEVEDSLIKAYNDELNFVLLKTRNKAAADFISEFNRLNELRTLGLVLKAILLENSWEEASRFIFPYGKLNIETCRSLVETKNVEEVFRLMGEKSLIGKVREILSGSENSLLKSIKTELTLTRHGLEKVFKKAQNLEGRDRFCIKILGILIDISNITAILRLKKLKFEKEGIEDYIFPVYYILKEDEVKRALIAENEKDALKVFSSGRYVNIVSPLTPIYEVKNDLSIFEIALKRYHAKECERAFYQLFHFTEAFAYLYLKLYEVKDLITIVIGKQFNIPPSEIEYLLTLHQPLYPT
ncbi:MAG: V-type ATPase subunit [Candidatus Bathyarchaeota archaeon]